MKSNFEVSMLLIPIYLTLLSSCSLFGKRGAIMNDGPIPTKKKALLETVPKEQYDQLSLKYAKLLKQVNRSAPEYKLKKETEEMAASLTKLSEETELAETVDAFGKNSKYNAQDFKLGLKKQNTKIPSIGYQNLEKEISYLNKAKALLAQKKYDSSLSILKELELSSNRQISVRAKFYIGELLFSQSEYDIALQIFEEIVSKNAFSGIVLKTLGRMIVCAEKLGQVSKKDKYYSILHDFFESA